MSKCYVFAYGTLLDSKVRFDILDYPTVLIKSSVTGFKPEEILLSGRSYPILIEDIQRQEKISGGYFEINESDIKKLDDYESAAYRRKLTHTSDGVTVWIYFR